MNKTIFSKRGIVTISALTGVAIFLAAGLAFAAQGKGGKFGRSGDSFDPDKMAEHMTERLTSRLDLSDDQQGRVKEIILEGHTLMGKRHDDAQARFAEAFTSDELSPAQAAELLNLREKMRAEMQGSFAEALSKVHFVLTPQQREQAVELLADSRVSSMMMGRGFDHGMTERSRGRRGGKGRHSH